MQADNRSPIRVGIVDDHLVVRQGLRQYLADFGDIEVVGEAADGVEALALLADTPVDVLLLDLAMPRKNGLDVLPEIIGQYPATRMIILTGCPKSHYAEEAKRRGAAAYLHKECEPLAIITAIREAGPARDGAANEAAFD